MEISFFYWMHAHLYWEPLTRFMLLITRLGDHCLIWCFCIVLLLAGRKTRRLGVCCAFSLLLSIFLGDFLLKPYFARARPCALLPEEWLSIRPPASYSFPSGHSANAFACAGVIALMKKGKAGAPALCFAALMAVSRVYLLMHYPSDILAGAALGLFCAWLSVKTAGMIDGLHQRRKQP